MRRRQPPAGRAACQEPGEQLARRRERAARCSSGIGLAAVRARLGSGPHGRARGRRLPGRRRRAARRRLRPAASVRLRRQRGSPGAGASAADRRPSSRTDSAWSSSGGGDRLADRCRADRRAQVGDGRGHGHGEHGIDAVVGGRPPPGRRGRRPRPTAAVVSTGPVTTAPAGSSLRSRRRVAAASVRDLQAVVAARVGRQDSCAARVGDDRDPVARRAAAGRRAAQRPRSSSPRLAVAMMPAWPNSASWVTRGVRRGRGMRRRGALAGRWTGRRRRSARASAARRGARSARTCAGCRRTRRRGSPAGSRRPAPTTSACRCWTRRTCHRPRRTRTRRCPAGTGARAARSPLRLTARPAPATPGAGWPAANVAFRPSRGHADARSSSGRPAACRTCGRSPAGRRPRRPGPR